MSRQAGAPSAGAAATPVEYVGSFFTVLDESLERLCHKQEGFTANHPHWALAGREIRLGHVARGADPYYIVRATPQPTLTHDTIAAVDLDDDDQLQAFVAPFRIGHSFYNSSLGPLWLTDESLTIVGEPLTPALQLTRDAFAFVGVELVAEAFSVPAAKEHAADLWNQAAFGQPGQGGSFVEDLRSIFDRFSSLLRRKSFMERRIHRYLHEHARYLLPDHRRCFFEHELILAGRRRPADFILERDTGLPALLIELETPSAQLFTKRGEPTKETNHAKAQIAEWGALHR